MTDMGNPGDLASLEPLEPLDAGGGLDAAGGAMSTEEATLQVLRSGLPAPGFNPQCRDKSFYKFLFAGVVMFVGCMMPFSAEPARPGYQTMSGATFLLISIGMIWTWWGAIHSNRSTGASLKWLLLSAIPLIAGIWNMIAFDAEAALQLAKARAWLPAEATTSLSWKDLFGDMWAGLGRRDVEAALEAETFWRLYGPGRFFVLLGALLAELGFLGGVLGGAKQNKQMKQQKQMAAAERKRR